MSYVRTHEEHRTDQDRLAEALKMVAGNRGKAVPAIAARPRLLPLGGQSVYRIMAADGTATLGFVTKTRTMWRFESIDGPVSRSRYADQIAMVIL